MSLAPSLLMPQSTSKPTAQHNDCPPSSQPETTLDSTDILRGQKAVDISHNGARYRLQTTRLGKLILTK